MIDLDGSLRSYWRWRLGVHLSDTYRDRALLKFPEDLRSYQAVIEETRPETIIELGTHEGGSALWFADQLQLLCGGGSIITIDTLRCDLRDDRITCLQGDLRSIPLPSVVGRTMVVDDSAHTYAVTTAALTRFSPLVTKGCYFVVEDTIVDTDLTIWPHIRGAGKAVEDFLSTTDRFVSRDRARYGLTMHMGGWLEAVA